MKVNNDQEIPGRRTGRPKIVVLLAVFTLCFHLLVLPGCDPKARQAYGEIIEAVLDLEKNGISVWTINVAGGMEEPGYRMRGIARKIRGYGETLDTGLIGLQEVPREMSDCFADNTRKNGATCLAAELGVQGRHGKPNGLVADDKWQIISMKNHENLGWSQSGRNLLEFSLVHVPTNHKLRFYVAHAPTDKTSTLTATLLGGPEERREKYIKDVLDIILEPNGHAGELPPIVVGDFNAAVADVGTPQESKEASLRLMDEHFWRPLDHKFECPNYGSTGTPVDHIFIGKKSSFPNTVGGFRPLKQLHITLKEEVQVGEGYFGKLSDAHNGEGFWLYIDEKNYEPGDMPGNFCDEA